MLTSACVVVFVGAVSPAKAGCPGCEAVAKKGEGFCCGHGIVFGLQLGSEELYKTLSGKEIDVNRIECPGCKSAHETNGQCSHCKVGMAGGKMYRSSAAHVLAKGSPVSEAAACQCKGCKTARAENGFCDKCGAGYIAGRFYRGKESYDAALAAHQTLANAIELAKKCVGCAVALVTDGTCPSCKVTYKDGKKTG
jgi:hypothetical protein